MAICSACRVDCSHSPSLRSLFSAVCDDSLCEPSSRQLFQGDRDRRAQLCPGCGRRVEAEDLSEWREDGQQVETQARLRRHICSIYCKSQEDFADPGEYSDYLEQREELIHRLTNPSSAEDVREIWWTIGQYEGGNQDQIMQAHGWHPRKKFQRTGWSLVEETGLSGPPLASENSKKMETEAASADKLCFQPSSRCHEDACIGREAESPAAEAAGDTSMGESSFLYAPSSPSSPQAMLGDKVRHMSGGGQSPNTCFKKARYYFFSDLAAGTKALAGGA